MVAANDDFADLIVLPPAGSSRAFDMTGATAEAGDPLGFPDLWYSFTAPADGRYGFRLETSPGVLATDVYAAIYTGGPALADLTLAAANIGQTIVPLTAGDTVYVAPTVLADSTTSGQLLSGLVVRDPATTLEIPPDELQIGYTSGSVTTVATAGQTEITAVTINDDDSAYTIFNSDSSTAQRYYNWTTPRAAYDEDFLLPDKPVIRVRAKAEGGTIEDAYLRLSLYIRNPAPSGSETVYSFAGGGGTHQIYSTRVYVNVTTEWATYDVPITAFVAGSYSGGMGSGDQDFREAWEAGTFTVLAEGSTDSDGTDVWLGYLAVLVSGETLDIPAAASGAQALRQYPRPTWL